MSRLNVRRKAGVPAVSLYVLGLLLWAASTAAGQELDAVLEVPVRQTVERAAQQAAEVVMRAVPDHVHTILYVEPVRTDSNRMTRLGARVRGALQIMLLQHYRSARLLDAPASGEPPPSAIRVSVELQPFDHQVLAVVRVLDRDGLLVDAGWVEMPRSTGISELLQPDLLDGLAETGTVIAAEPEAPPEAAAAPEAVAPVEADGQPATEAPEAPPEVEAPQPALAVSGTVVSPQEPAGPPAAAPQPSIEPPIPPLEEVPPDPVEPVAQPVAPQGFEQPAPAGPPAAQPPSADDPYEPDDVAGYEVPLPLEEDARFERTLTAGDRDRFELALPAPSTVTVAIESDLDTLIALYHAGNAVPFGLHDSGFTGEMDAGVYVIEVLAADASSSGAYALTVEASPLVSGDAAEPAGETPDEAATGAGGAEALAQPAELQPGEPQERSLRQAREWFQLSARRGLFYSVTIRSDSDSVRASLHNARDEPPFLPLIPSEAGELVGALYLGADPAVLQVTAAEADLGQRYSVALDVVTPPRVFADRAWVEQADLGPIRHHNLRVFDRDAYQMSLEAAPETPVGVAVFYLPGMIDISPQEPGLSRFELVQGDYLVLVRPLEGGTVGRVCWHLAEGASNCA